MSYPQPNANLYAINGYQYFRLNTLLSSPGDIYESEQGGLAFAIGPDSDISKVTVASFDDQVPTYMQITSIGVERAFTGRIAARNEVTYQPANRPGRVLFWSTDLYDTSFRPEGFNPLIDSFNVITPRLDVIEYFSSPPTLLPQRNDKTYNLQDWPTLPNADADAYFLIPYWGRRYGMVELTNKSAGPWSFALSGVNFAISGSSANYTQVTPIVADAPVTAGTQLVSVVTSTQNGMFDALLLRFHRLDPDLTAIKGPIRITVSDNV